MEMCIRDRRWSIAPELEGALELGEELSRRGILAAIGHSDAEYDLVMDACEHGYSHVTHLYSGMNGVHRRNAYRFLGIVESAYLLDELTVEIIADGCHLPPELIRLVYRIKGPERTALITDSLRGAGMPDGPSISGSVKNGQAVIIEDGVAKMPDRKAFAGSVATVSYTHLDVYKRQIQEGKLAPETPITASAAAAQIPEGSSTANIKAGEVLTVEQLLYCLLLPSANEAAQILAEAVDGDQAAFVEHMNLSLIHI